MNYLKVLLGNLLITTAYAFITVPNELINGGVTSFSMILGELSSIDVAALVNTITVLLLLCCYLFLGRKYFADAVFSCLCYMGMFTLFHSMPFSLITIAPVSVPLAALMVGTGYYFCITAGSTAVGFDVVAIILNMKNSNINIASTMFAINVLVLLAGMFTFGWMSVLAGVVFTAIQTSLLNYLLSAAKSRELKTPSGS